MKECYLLVLVWLLSGPLLCAQPIRFARLPANQQLIPRNAQSVGVIPIAGRVNAPGYERVSVQVLRGNALYRHLSQPLFYGTATTAPFSITASIPAELMHYRVRVYLHGGAAGLADSVLVADRQQLVAGDAYVIAGQSNATAYIAPPVYTYQSEFIRTFGVYTGGDEYNPADTLWAVGNATASALVGTWGMEVARRLIEQYGVPVCFINGAWGGAPIQLLNIRNEANPTDLTTNYGRLLYRVSKAGLTGAVKAYFYRQGENETSGWASGWPGNFDILFQNVRRDYPNLRRFYLFQIHILAGTSSQDTPYFRDYQRRLQTLHPLIQSHATVGTATYDGIHFGLEGHRQTGLELFRLVARDVFGSTDTVQITSPDVRKVYYSSAARNELVVQFEEGQRLRWARDTTVNDPFDTPLTHQLRQWFYLDGQSDNVVAGRADGNRVYLTLKGSRPEQQLGYLPPNYPAQDSWLPTPPGFASAFPGPFLTNERGLRAFSFWNVPISAPLAPLITFRATPANGQVLLTWADHPAEQQYVLEHKPPGASAFVRLASLPANAVAYTDATALSTGTYQYRLRALTAAAETQAEASAAVQCQTSGGARSLRSGNWQQMQTWQCGNVPTVSSPATVDPIHTVIVSKPVTVRRLWLGGTLRLQAGGVLRVGQ